MLPQRCTGLATTSTYSPKPPTRVGLGQTNARRWHGRGHRRSSFCLGCAAGTSEVVVEQADYTAVGYGALLQIEDGSVTVGSSLPPNFATNNILPLPSGLASDSQPRSFVASTSPPQAVNEPTETKEAATEQNDFEWAKSWALLCLAVSYIHQAATSNSLPAMLPTISSDLHLSDLEGAWLTSGYAYLYALALIPMGLLADRLPRNKLLAAGTSLWSLLTIVASHANSFQDLVGARVGFAAAQATQNPVSFSLIPDLFPKRKSTAMAVYNTAIYLGRAVSFGCVMLAGVLASHTHGEVVAPLMVPLDEIDYQQMMILYTTGDHAAVAPLYDYMFSVNYTEAAAAASEAPWREVLRWLALPGFAISAAMFLTVKDPRNEQVQSPSLPGLPASTQTSAALAPARSAIAEDTKPVPDTLSQSQHECILELFKSPGFLAVTTAAALNDFASYSLIAFQSIFLERILHMEASDYAPLLIGILPVGGIIGGIGGGALADVLGVEKGGRFFATAGASFAAAPFFAGYVLAGNSVVTFSSLLVGFAFAEAWRAPAAVMIRSTAPSSLGSTASAVYLSIRNIVGGLGPLCVAKLAEVVGLQKALLVSPAMYLASAMMFVVADAVMKKQEMEQKALTS